MPGIWSLISNPSASVKKRSVDGLVGCAVHDVGQVRDTHGRGVEHRVRRAVDPLDIRPGTVDGSVTRRRGPQRWGDGDLDRQPGDRLVDDRHRRPVVGDRAFRTHRCRPCLGLAGEPLDVVTVVGAHPEAQQVASSVLLEHHLLAAVTGGEVLR